MKMITAVAVATSLALSGVSFAQNTDDDAAAASLQSSGPESLAGVGSLGAGGAAVLAGLTALALVAALTNGAEGAAGTTTTTAPASK